MFRRRRAVDDDRPDDNDQYDDTGAAPEAAAAGDVGTADAPAAAPPPRPEGPWDAADAPDDELLDLGGLRVPVIDGFDLSITAEEDVPVMVTYGAPDGVMQLHAFAAPRTAGIWSEVRDEIRESLRQAGGRSQEAPGPFGMELAADIPVQTPDGQTALQKSRFIGVDGPRWFLRALITGPVMDDPARVRSLEDVIRRTVVVRGGEAMAPRDVIPLRLPREVLQAAEEAAAAEAAEQGAAGEGPAGGEALHDGDGDGRATERPRLAMPERGPEITEVR